MPDPFLSSRIASFLSGLLDDVAEIGDAHASATHATSYGRDDAPAVHERDVLVEQLADDLAAALTSVPGPRDEVAGFFRPGRTYAHGQDGYTAPEATTVFRVEYVTRHPEHGTLRAIGWARTGKPGSRWHGYFRDEDQTDGWAEMPESPKTNGGAG